jgi:signal transduction histidine kinase
MDLTMLEAANIDFTIEVADDVKDLVIPMEKRKDFYLIFKESINNIAKYSETLTATARLFREHQHLIMTIEDKGKGFEVEKLRSGNGLVNMKERAKFIGET